MEIRRVIKKHKKIMFDTAPIIYFIEEHKDFGFKDQITRLGGKYSLNRRHIVA